MASPRRSSILFPVHNFTETGRLSGRDQGLRQRTSRGRRYWRHRGSASAPKAGHAGARVQAAAPARVPTSSRRPPSASTAETQLGVDPPAGQVTVAPVDLNGDGLTEYRLENDQVRVTLLAIGARVIEYVVKEKADNVLFKLWPEKE
ncbi:MAG: hypothetical protein MZV63_63050 [Marinilabiliales bacterium]|nr:hypothetical protein [Marinilabiliales bacterium]